MSERKNIAKRAGTVGFFTLVSRVAGLARDMAIAHAFGTLAAADAFFVAFRIPNLLRRLFAEGALTVSFVPVFTQALRRSEADARRVARLSFTLLAAVLVGVSVVGVLISPWLVKLTAWGFSRDPEKFALTVQLTRVMFPYVLLVSLAAWAMGVLNSLKHFAAPAASSILMNLGIIAGALVFAAWIDPPVFGLAVGVLVGGVFQFAINLPPLARRGFLPRWEWNTSDPSVRKIVGMMVPAAYGAAVYQFNVIVITLLASFLPTGSVSYLWYADRVMEFPLGVFAVSLATVILPTLSDHAADRNMEALKRTFGFALRLVFFVTVPAAGGLMILSDEIIRVLFQQGSFDAASTGLTARALVCFAVGLPFISGVRVTSNAFYSLQDSRTPVRLANWSMLANLVLSLALMRVLEHAGLALAVSLSSLLNFALQAAEFRKKVGALGLKRILSGTARTALATLTMAAAVWFFRLYVPVFEDRLERSFAALRLLLHIGVGVAAYVVAGLALRMEEFRKLLEAVKKGGRGRTPPPTDLSAGVEI
jgi:putative peptidoglycan lipid II flippase